MITKEHAEQMVRKRFEGDELHITGVDPVNTGEAPIDPNESYLGVVEMEPEGWKVAYEIKLSSPLSDGREWVSGSYYVVEVKPGPYLVFDQ